MLSNSNLKKTFDDQFSDFESEINFIELLNVIIENLWLLILAPLIVGLIALWFAFQIPPIFTARTTILPPSQVGVSSANALLSQLGGLANITGPAAGLKTSSELYIAYLESHRIQNALIKRFDLKERFKKNYLQDIRNELLGKTKITGDKKSGLILIEVQDQDPQFAADLSNAYVVELSKLLGELNLKESKAKREKLEVEINEAINKSYRSTILREAMIQTLLREFEAARLEERKDNPFISQIDIAEKPELKSSPRKAKIAINAAFGTVVFLLFYIFIKKAIVGVFQNPKSAYSKQKFWRLLRRSIWLKA